MNYTPLLVLTLALVAATSLSLQDSQSYDSLLSAFSTMQEHADIGDRPEYSYTSTLQREVEQLVDSPSVSKDSRSFRRYTTVRERCCDIPERPTMFEEINATYPECYQEYSEGSENNSYTRLFCDVVQCLGKKMGVVNGEGYVLPDVYMIAVCNHYTEESLKTVARRVAPDCITKSNAAAKKAVGSRHSVKGCNLAPYWAQYCIDSKLFNECPEDMQINNEQCHQFRKRKNERKNKGRD